MERVPDAEMAAGGRLGLAVVGVTGRIAVGSGGEEDEEQGEDVSVAETETWLISSLSGSTPDSSQLVRMVPASCL
jgi:hypothetical protein